MPRTLFLDRPDSPGRGCFVVGLNPGTSKPQERAFYRQAELDLAAAYAYASNVMVENMLARDAEEGIAAFVEKRPPTWEDR